MAATLPKLQLLSAGNAWQERSDVLSAFLREKYRGCKRPLKILEAGCGRSWPLEMGDLQVELTGVDIDQEALNARQTEVGDLVSAIVGDLHTVEFQPEQFDVIYCCEVLEHVDGAEQVLRRLMSWLKRDGAALLIFPDRDTVFGFATRFSPHWMHVAYHRYVLRIADAGRPGFGPYRTYYDPLVSRRGMHRFCAANGCRIALERGRPPAVESWTGWFRRGYETVAPLISNLTRGALASDRIGLVYVIEKSAAAGPPLPALQSARYNEQPV